MLGTSSGLPRDKDLYINDNNNDNNLIAFCQTVVTRAANGKDNDNDDNDNDNDARCYNVWVNKPSGEHRCRTREG